MRARPHLSTRKRHGPTEPCRGTLPWRCTVVAQLSPAAAGGPWKPRKRVCGLVGAPLRFGGLHPGAAAGAAVGPLLRAREWTGNAPLRLALIQTTRAWRGWVDERSRRSCLACTRQDGLRRMAGGSCTVRVTPRFNSWTPPYANRQRCPNAATLASLLAPECESSPPCSVAAAAPTGAVTPDRPPPPAGWLP